MADHVANVQRTIGADGGVDGAEPLVGRGEEILAGRGMRGGEGGAGGCEHLALHEILRGLANEGVASADDDAAGAGVRAGVLAADETGDVTGGGGVRAERIHLGSDGHDIFDGVGKGIKRIAPEQPGGNDHVHERIAVAGYKAVADGIKALAELADQNLVSAADLKKAAEKLGIQRDKLDPAFAGPAQIKG